MINTTTIRQCVKASEPGRWDGAVWTTYRVADDGRHIYKEGKDGESIFSFDEWIEKLSHIESYAVPSGVENSPRVTCPECGWIDHPERLASTQWKCPECGNRDFLLADFLSLFQATKDLVARFNDRQ